MNKYLLRLRNKFINYRDADVHDLLHKEANLLKFMVEKTHILNSHLFGDISSKYSEMDLILNKTTFTKSGEIKKLRLFGWDTVNKFIMFDVIFEENCLNIFTDGVGIWDVYDFICTLNRKMFEKKLRMNDDEELEKDVEECWQEYLKINSSSKMYDDELYRRR